jgi:hypothetical protein
MMRIQDRRERLLRQNTIDDEMMFQVWSQTRVDSSVKASHVAWDVQLWRCTDWILLAVELWMEV